MARRRGARLLRRADRRQLRHRRRAPGPARGIDRRPALALSRLRRADRRLRQRAGRSPGCCCEAGRAAAARAISARYPLTELALGALYAATVLVLWDEPWRGGAGPGLRHDAGRGHPDRPRAAHHPQQDPDRRGDPGAAIAAAGDPGSLPERAIAAAAAGGLLFAAALAYPRGMGLGDVKLAATMGLYLGRNVAPGDPRRPARRLARRPGDDRP